MQPQAKLKRYHKLLPIVLILLSIVLIIIYGWSFYATVTERSGLKGDMYFYYQLTPTQYALYTGLVTLSAGVFIVMQAYCLLTSNGMLLTKTFKAFLIFILLYITCEIYLELRFTGKG